MHTSRYGVIEEKNVTFFDPYAGIIPVVFKDKFDFSGWLDLNYWIIKWYISSMQEIKTQFLA